MLIKPVKIQLKYEAVIYKNKHARFTDWFVSYKPEDISRFFRARINQRNLTTHINPENMSTFEVYDIRFYAEFMLRPAMASEIPNFLFLGADQPEVSIIPANKTDQSEYDCEVTFNFYVNDADLVYMRLLAD